MPVVTGGAPHAGMGAPALTHRLPGMEWMQHPHHANAEHRHADSSAGHFHAHANRTRLANRTVVGTAAAAATVGRQRVAFLLSGLLMHGMVGSYALSEPQQIARIKAWIDELRAANVDVDVFVHTELFVHPPKLRSTERVPLDASALRSVPPVKLAAMLEALKPVKLSLHHESPFCAQRGRDFCSCTAAWPRWTEQMLKVARCMELVREYERETLMPYSWVISMRGDYNTEAADHNSAARHVLSVLRTADSPRLVRTKPFAGPAGRFDSGYGQADWFWMAQRSAADTMTSVVNASCAWLRCIHATPGSIQNERLLVEWALKGGLTIAKMPPVSNPRFSGAGIAVSPGMRSMVARKCDTVP